MTSKEKIRSFFAREAVEYSVLVKEDFPVSTSDSSDETSSGSQETVQVLRRVLASERQPIAPEIFSRDEAMGEHIEEYEKALDLHISSPGLLLLGENIWKTQLEQEARELVYGEKLKSLDLGVQNLKQEEERLSRQSWEAERAIERAGRGQVPEPQDFSRILGRIRVRIASSGQEGKLGFIGRVASVFISPRRVHPEIEAYSRRIAATVRELNSQEAQKRQFSNAYIRDKVEAGNHPARIREDIFESLDDWAVENFDRVLVHALYYPQRRFGLIQSYRRVHSMSPLDFKDFEADLSRYFSLPSEVVRVQRVHSVKDGGDDLQVVEQDVPVEVSTSFVHPLFFLRGADRVLGATNRREIEENLKDILGIRAYQDIPMITNDLLVLARARNPLALPEVKKISGGWHVQKETGASHRWAKKGRRILFSLDRQDGLTVIVICRVIPRHGDSDYGTGR